MDSQLLVRDPIGSWSCGGLSGRTVTAFDQDDNERRYRVGTALRSVRTPSSSTFSPSRCQLRVSQVEHERITSRDPSTVSRISTSSFLHVSQLDMVPPSSPARTSSNQRPPG